MRGEGRVSYKSNGEESRHLLFVWYEVAGPERFYLRKLKEAHALGAWHAILARLAALLLAQDLDLREIRAQARSETIRSGCGRRV